MTIEQELAAAQEKITALEADSETAKQSIAAALKEKADAVAQSDNAKSEIEGLRAKISALTEANTKLQEQLDAAQKSFTDLEASFPSKVNAEVTRTLAASGHAPIDANVTAEPIAPVKADFSKLSGLEKAIAAHKACKA